MINFKNNSYSYYQWWLKVINFKSRVTLFNIDFKKPWWKIILKQKKYVISIILSEACDNIFYYSTPLLIGWIISTRDLKYFFFFMAAWFLTIIIEYISLYFSSIVHTQTTHSLLYNAHQYFLTVDPIYHSIRSSGKIVGKIDRATHAFEEFLDIVTFDLLSTVVGVMTVIIAFAQFDAKLGLMAMSMILTIGIINTFLQFISTQAFEPRVILASDKLNSVNLENLAQVQFIRSCFASNEMAENLKTSNKEMMNISGTSWLAFAALSFITRLLFICSILILGIYIINLIKAGSLSMEWGAALLITYISGSYETMKIGKKIKRLLKSTTNIKDLFAFVKEFGKQTFPVLSTQTTSVSIPIINKEKDTLILDVEDLYFDYDEKAKIFENHRLYLEISQSTPNKLYGIIGPSGTGKTTFVSILGGQLHPTVGSVKIQDVDIYTVDDFTRKHLVAMQGQVATSLRGTVRYNLLFGLPKEYSDQDLMAILEAVGLWQIFSAKSGLDTIIGESGFTLSGGQRQRLNFANLYLRAQYYKPALILIDEPTSSLDQVSEKAITHMIDELAQNAITFVIAHRINTLEQAVGILDFSLLKNHKDITFYPTEELINISPYYRKLIKGEVTFE